MLIPNPASQKKNWQSIYFRFHILRLTSEWYGIEINTYNLPANIFLNENLDGYCSCRHFYLALQKNSDTFNFALKKPDLAVYSIVRFQPHLWQFHNSRTQFCNFCFLTNCFYSLKKIRERPKRGRGPAETPQFKRLSKSLFIFYGRVKKSLFLAKRWFSSTYGQNPNRAPGHGYCTFNLWLKFKNGNGMCKSVIFSKSGTACFSCFSCLLPRTLLRPILELDGQLMTLDFRGRSSGFSLRP